MIFWKEHNPGTFVTPTLGVKREAGFCGGWLWTVGFFVGPFAVGVEW